MSKSDNPLEDDLQNWYRQFLQQQQALRADLEERLDDVPAQASNHLAPHTDDYYAQFGQDHDVLKARLLQQLPPPRPLVANRISRREWMIGALPRIAATIAFAAIGGSWWLKGTSKPAYAVEEVFTAVDGAQRLYLKGHSLNAKLPWEIYVEMPDANGHGMFWRTHFLRYSNTHASPARHRTVYGQRGSNGQRRYYVEIDSTGDSAEHFPPGETPFYEEDRPIWMHLEIANWMNHAGFGESLLFWQEGPSQFEFQEQETIDGKSYDIFVRTRKQNTLRLHVDPVTRLPCRVTCSSLQKEEQTAIWTVDQISINPAERPATMIPIAELEGEAFAPLSPTTTRFPRSAMDGYVNGPHVYVPFGLRWGSLGIVCWHREDDRDNVQLEEPTFRLVGDDQAVAFNLGTTHEGTMPWNWVAIPMPPQGDSVAIHVQHERIFRGSTERRQTLTKEIVPTAVGIDRMKEALRLMGSQQEAKRILDQLRGWQSEA